MIVVRVLRAAGQTFITAGLVILLFVGYELWFTNIQTAREQRKLESAIEEEWRHGAGGSFLTPADVVRKIPLGTGVAIIRIPKFGHDWGKVVVEGVGRADLAKGPGHYPGTQLPGQVGNFVVSGHRTTHGAPFNRVDELKPGDAIVIETRDTWYTYRVDHTEIVKPTAIDVAYSVPHHKDAKPTVAMITLTSCNPKYSARTRIIVFGKLSDTQPKSQGSPPALEG